MQTNLFFSIFPGLDIRALNTNALSAVRCHRIEEVIYHRFDQFNNAAQTVLKMASVACSNGTPITLDLLCFVLDDENYEEFSSPSTMTSQKLAAMSFKSRKRNLRPDINVVNALFDILQCEDFIRVVNKNDGAIKHSDSSSCDGSGRTPQGRNKTFSNDFIDITGRNSNKYRDINSTNGGNNSGNSGNISSSYSSKHHNATVAPSMSSETILGDHELILNNENNMYNSNNNSSMSMKINNRQTTTATSKTLRMSCETELGGFSPSINSDNKSPTNRNSIQLSSGNSNSDSNPNSAINSTINSNIASNMASASSSMDVMSGDQFDNSINLPNFALPPIQPAQHPTQLPPLSPIPSPVQLPALTIDINPIEAAQHEDQKKIKITKELIASNTYVFEFNIALEQRTIYDLLLDDQKQVIHHCVAEYYESLRHNKQIQSMSEGVNLANYAQTAENYCEESFHWQKAGEWSAAMTCSYQAAVMEKNEQKRCEYLGKFKLIFGGCFVDVESQIV